ncbi:3-deoxy-manno-octulosonate cytidylyltransferase,3-deoxy-manno-octulosonate cytidylyltransferase,Spore coat polysaccharide biosynthesis protein, predicted glycosyltransferase,3-deoxy-D-manno-octulosonate cytidylyltransferase,Cytidylyltransferase [Chlamydia poikilotherma]|uniref:3-deoxy-manno-octulosonate cytidylyltransferase n=1 Tax=Chlamydia poikilotherma TaxID=1967783 RepID=A0A3B0Q0E0_9CHLA|nr:3-deoxy-manno-octulosonate cytidylyltransferase [Chlamydia poikilotherma]SYX09065.1 3-deoxy-manno-octulosonate cytidylyltransferase,3-deoxy-manno-octulosonate cytidylyltransferase,Spore coat polysaccharide biosynthesis protein, predicted glycosyltransferase,3-deoxy-D-manno-octulosonate cytidylyltransferase,Cytidylyltransferase [Chlamydia poikilotherma]
MKEQVFASKKVGVLPARWGSVRFTGKPLANILGKSLIQRTYENINQNTTLDKVVVATDDQRIMDHVLEFGGDCVMTSPECANGTERTAETVSRYFPEAEIIVNIQGDEPCLQHTVVDTLVRKLEEFPEIQMVTPVAKTMDPHEILTNQKVKCVFDKNGKALYFSRSPIPHILKKETPIYLHIGVYAFRRNALFNYIEYSPTPLSQVEDLEQLRMLEHGGSIHVCVVEAKSPSVDYPEDINKVEKYLTCHSSASF